MIETKIYQNENGIYVLEIYMNGKIIRECYNDKDEMVLSEIADVAKETYKCGFDDGYYQGKDDYY